MRVLLIEPDIQLGTIYRQALQRAGHIVSWQSGAQSAIEAADRQKPDVVVLELQLARHNGVEFLYEFRSYPDWEQVPIILHTSVTMPPVNKELLERLGVRALHYKPQTTLGELVASIGRALTPA